MPDTLRLVLAIAAKDIRAELRSRTALLSAVVFAALVLVIFNFARDPTAIAAVDLAPSVLWVTFALAAMVALNRAFTVERENGALDGLLLAPVPRSAVFLGKLVANLAFVGTVEAVALPLFVLFFNVDLGHALPGLVGVTALATIGFVAVGTIFSAMAVRTRFAELLLPVLLLPFMVPPLIGAVQVTARLLADRPLSEMLGWLRLLALYDVVFVTLCTMAFASVVDE
ncbi:MAG TPA: heme exporter protein CcmB [Gemmatimonadales bacterium]|nr:heme exporter protein CcmB [Gemmatimonadales bacterium]